MGRGWQLWLSPRPHRTETPLEPQFLAPGDAALFEFITEDDGRMVVKETHYKDHPAVQAGLTGPPLHIHLGQNEYFQVEQGTLAVIRHKTQHVLTRDDGVFEIPAGTRHRFWTHSPVEEDVIFKVWAEPNVVERGFDEKCLRNYLGYLKDCQQQNVAPSIFQMALFGWMSDTILLTPPFWVPIWVLKSVQHVMGNCIGRYLLGYQDTYPEYNIKPRDSFRDGKKSV